MTVVTLRAYKYALNPSPRQARYLDGHCGAARKAFNWGLGRVKAVMDQRAAETSYGVPDELLTPAISWSMYSLRNAWNQVKASVAPWWAEYSKEAYASGLTQLAVALKNWADSRKGKRRGRVVGFPRFKSKRKAPSRAGSPPAPSAATTGTPYFHASAASGCTRRQHRNC
ncbi:helix-turn-helix protein [Kribbella sp. VKM Ac-2571]|uniref:helix-turn-helix domain-containing protein n=1 Tax=Kribbella sp. VKM Ac-2571 TaxID=2512222 RepID=UPI0010EEFC06|nr:helix-turn-helix domain-containing protein [Kribbella sp. VKM Ac-2571]TDO58101.1 helix-turn-helix protein [Kribbella sp. VKM Ac-2571]